MKSLRVGWFRGLPVLVFVCGSLAARAASYYVNDASTANDAWCSAVGDDANDGATPGTPKATLQDVLADYDLGAGDTIYVDTGCYLLTSALTVGSSDGGTSNLHMTIRGSPGGTVLDGGVVLDNVTGVTLRDLAITNASCAVRLSYSRDTRLDSLDISGAWLGVNLYDSWHNRIANCAIHHNLGDGVRAEYFSGGNRIENCTVAFNAGHSVSMRDCDTAVDVRNSILVASGSNNACVYQLYTSIEMCNPHGCWYLTGEGRYTGDHNDLCAVNGADIGRHESSRYPTLDDWRVHLPQDTNSFSLDPLFVDAAGGDLHVRSTAVSGTWVKGTGQWTQFPDEHSPCIDAGDPAAAFADEPLWNGGRLNQGAYGNTPQASRSPHAYYVNDGSTVADAWCSAAGSDVNPGTTSNAPKATVRAILDAYDLEPGDTIYLDTGHYTAMSNILFASGDGGAGGAYVSLAGSPYGVTVGGGTTSGCYGVAVSNADFVRVVGVTFTGGWNGVFLRGANHCVFSNIAVRGAASSGVRVWYGDGHAFDRLEVSGCGGHGVLMDIEADGNSITHGVIWSNAGNGVRAEAFRGAGFARSNRVEHCTIAWNSNHQVYVTGYGEVWLSNSIVVASGPSNCCAFEANTYKGGPGVYYGDYNDLHAVGGAYVGGQYLWDPGITTYFPLSAWQAQGDDAHSLDADPRFVDGAGGDFHLRSSAPSGTYVKALSGWTSFPGDFSPCIDAGDPAKPCAAEPLPNGGRLNLGAYGNTPEASRPFGGPSAIYFVNDGLTAGDAWCAAPGSDGNPGTTPMAPKATLQSVIESYDLEPGDKVYVDSGVYPITNSCHIRTNDSGSAANRVCLIANTGRVVVVNTNHSTAFYLEGAEYVDVSGFTISNAHTGVYCYYAWDCGIRDVAVRGATVGIKMEYGGYHQVRGADVRGGQEGFMVYESVHNWILNSVVWSNSGDGVHVMHGAAPTHVYCCTIGYNGYQQIDLAHTNTSLDLWNSIVVASGSGNTCIWQYDEGYGVARYRGDYNLLYAVNSASIGGYYHYVGYPTPSETYYATLAAWTAHGTQDVHSLSADPLFVGTGGDLHLRSSAANGTYVAVLGGWTNFPGQDSPGIDAGAPGDSCANEPAWNGGLVNAGAYGNTPWASRSADTDGDLLSDSIERHRAGSDPADADSDDDGMGDRHEHIAGTDPRSRGSVFELACGAAPGGGGGTAVIRWPSATGRTYRIESALSVTNDWYGYATGVAATPPMNTYTAALGSAQTRLFRIKVEE